jgi:DNA-binding NarL/FixJ family response regulator
VAQARGALSATSLLSTLQLDLVLIDATVAEEEMEALLSWVKVHHPRVQCVALTMTSRQRDLALAWGADIAIHRADLTSHLKAMLDCVPSSSIHEVNLDSADWSAN